MAKKPHLDPDELAAFMAAVAGVKPLVKQDKIRLKPPLVKRYSVQIEQKSPAPALLPLSNESPLAPVATEDLLAYKQVCVSNKILRKLQKGQYTIEAKLDLHGMVIEEARMATDEFLHACSESGVRTILIIHGKGLRSNTPVLKNKLNYWLRHTELILAFCSAQPKHGGHGAMYVLLKNKQEKAE